MGVLFGKLVGVSGRLLRHYHAIAMEVSAGYTH